MFTIYVKTGSGLTPMVKADTMEEALDVVSKLGSRLCIIDEEEPAQVEEPVKQAA